MIDPRLAELRQRWAARPPGLDRSEWLGDISAGWLQKGPLRQQIDALERLVTEGEPRLALVLQANDLAWKGERTAPGTLLLSWDPWFEVHPDSLAETAERFQVLARTGPAASGLRALVGDTRDHVKDRTGERLSLHLTAGREVFAYDCVFFPELLPGRRIRDVLLPVVVLRRGPAVCAVVPTRLWPAALRARWEGPA